MLWLLGKVAGAPGSKSRKRLVLCCCEVARLALKYVPKGEHRPRIAIETAERHCRGEATLEEVRAAAAAAAAAYAYAAAAYAAAAAAAAYADAAYAAAYAYAAARERVRKQSADIVRKHYVTPPRLTQRKPGET